MTASSLVEINQDLSEFPPLATKITDLKKDIRTKEAEILVAILQKLTPIIPLLTPELEFYNRCELVILKEAREVPIYVNGHFYHESELILYENGDFVREFRYGEHGKRLAIFWPSLECPFA